MKRFFYTLIALCASYTSNLSADPYYQGSNDYYPNQNNNYYQGPTGNYLGANDCCEDPCCDDNCWGPWSLEFRVAAFIPVDKRVRDIYNNVWADYQIQVGKRFWTNWQLFGEFSGYQKNGHSSLGDKTRLRVFPLSFGVKYFFNLCNNLEAYVGGGVVYSWLRIHDESPYVHQHVNKGQFGGVIKTGLVYTFCNNWFVDVFADYVFQRFSYHGVSCDPYVTRQTAHLDGLKVGGGVGYNF